GTLLRAEDGRGAVDTGERVVDIAGGDQLHVAQPRHAAEGGGRGQRGAAVRQGVPGRVQYRCAQRRQHARPGVVGGGAAEPDDHLPYPRLHGGRQQRAETVGRGGPRVALLDGEQVQAADLRALHVPGGAGDQYPGRDRPAERIRRRYRDLVAADRGRDHVQETGTPVGERPAPSDPDLVARATRAKAALGDRLFVLGHHYQRDEVIQFADVTGDSFKLAREAAARPQAEFIVFCGVHFMAESADILTGDAQ